MKKNIQNIHEYDLDVLVMEQNALQTIKEKVLMLYNDDFNTFDHVIECLVEYCSHTPEQANQCALLVHHKGKCDIKHGLFDDLKPIYEALIDNKLTAKIE